MKFLSGLAVFSELSPLEWFHRFFTKHPVTATLLVLVPGTMVVAVAVVAIWLAVIGFMSLFE